jgi:hypothetical protein
MNNVCFDGDLASERAIDTTDEIGIDTDMDIHERQTRKREGYTK